jgi:hypothetical protein
LRPFPIQSKHIRSIPWAMLAPNESRALRNHGQSLQVLAGRGGLCPMEALLILKDLPWDGRVFRLPTDREAREAHLRKAVAELRGLLEAFSLASAGDEEEGR